LKQIKLLTYLLTVSCEFVIQHKHVLYIRRSLLLNDKFCWVCRLSSPFLYSESVAPTFTFKNESSKYNHPKSRVCYAILYFVRRTADRSPWLGRWKWKFHTSGYQLRCNHIVILFISFVYLCMFFKSNFNLKHNKNEIDIAYN
jgi:hypothetical protein